MWKLKNKIVKTKSNTPAAKKDEKGNLITSHNELKNLYEKTYIDRLKHREITKDFEDIKIKKENLFELNLKAATEKQSPQWSKKDLMNVLKKLKSG